MTVKQSRASKQSTAPIDANRGRPGNAQPGQQAGGVWVRALGGTVDTDNNGVTTAELVGVTIPGAVTCNTTTRQDFDGYQAGFDIGQLNIGGANFFLGATAGQLAARSRDVGGTFKASTDVPFAGIYGAFTSGNFYLSGQVRWDFYEHRVTDTANGVFGQKFEGRGFSVSGNAGYKFSRAQGVALG